jgi:hypothetical protein
MPNGSIYSFRSTSPGCGGCPVVCSIVIFSCGGLPVLFLPDRKFMIAKAALFVNRSLNFDKMWGIWWGNKEGVGRKILYNAALCQEKQEMMRGGFTRLGKPKARFR